MGIPLETLKGWSKLSTPVLQALVLADHIYSDTSSGKKVIAGTFNRLLCESFPHRFSRPTYAYISLTGVRGRKEIKLRYLDLSSFRALMESPSITMESSDPLRTCELIFEVPPFPMPHKGVYAFEVLCDDETLGTLRILVDEVQQHGEKGDHDA